MLVYYICVYREAFSSIYNLKMTLKIYIKEIQTQLVYAFVHDRQTLMTLPVDKFIKFLK